MSWYWIVAICYGVDALIVMIGLLITDHTSRNYRLDSLVTLFLVSLLWFPAGCLLAWDELYED